VTYKEGDELDKVNQDLQNIDHDSAMKIGLVYMGRQAPGVNNVVDGLLRFKAQQKREVELLGFINGVDGLLKEDFEIMTRETYQYFNNLGGIDYIGRGFDELRSDFQKQKAAEVCTKLGLDGLVLVGATTAMTDAAYLTEFFLQNKV
jgi:diphosphate-dependent phosphofructokinase